GGAKAAGGKGWVAGGAARGLLELLGREGLSAESVSRHFLPTELIARLSPGFGQTKVDQIAEAAFDTALRTFEQPPPRFHLAAGWPQLLRLPLVTISRIHVDNRTGPVRIPEVMNQLVQQDT